jgi:hypothetical protein
VSVCPFLFFCFFFFSFSCIYRVFFAVGLDISPELLAASGIPPQLLPEIAPKEPKAAKDKKFDLNREASLSRSLDNLIVITADVDDSSRPQQAEGSDTKKPELALSNAFLVNLFVMDERYEHRSIDLLKVSLCGS